MTVLAYLGLGSNVGDRRRNMAEAIRMLEGSGRVAVEKISSLYETEPVGYEEQGPFLNAVVAITCDFSPLRLLRLCQGIEDGLGRERTIRWGPRTIDIDILLYANRRIRSKNLEVPHPRMWERGFVMVPLAEIAPDLRTPSGTRAGDLARAPAMCDGVALHTTGQWWRGLDGEDAAGTGTAGTGSAGTGEADMGVANMGEAGTEEDTECGGREAPLGEQSSRQAETKQAETGRGHIPRHGATRGRRG
ncbi:MAG: 2-amino-4-hydroxy-6-hydroxymethyldihydropteridine diphosphokinase [Firmicutes bacterium]|jgi:2-amino-4-hydroxy-6-hydroxymethyldihydropteridine diphosphokinase|nr:2-amino-4-hydroxy-6-hydroxymethyldihydropteridine diphosphokinase [Bacillota bacterium]MDH7495322.1 2-amino-4-hydroxy-6-hydroxymethyldihydropteridine diphosphokinase [Bacillota bacterium]